MKRTGVVICNYNKKEYVAKCMASLNKQTLKEFDVYVVDNASTDGSAEYLSELFGDEIHLICNTENLGGSGGFNTGIRIAMEKGYDYIMLLDNDVVLAEDCMEKSIHIMNIRSDIGMLGCEILKMDEPDRIQEFGPTLNYEVMNFELNHGGEIDHGQLPVFADCDYVPACAMMVRKEVIKKIGLMPQENFIYYDDITWGVRCHRAGYRVMVTSLAKAWHKGGAAVNPTTFASYYLNRNKIRFFTQFICTEGDDNKVTEMQISKRAEDILRDIFEGVYSCYKNGMSNMSKTRMEAFLDALCDVTGKAEPYKIRQRENPKERFDIFLEDKKTILLHMHGLWEPTRRIVNRLYELEKKTGNSFEITIRDDSEFIGLDMLGNRIGSEADAADHNNYNADLHICRHIYEMELKTFDRCWIDSWRNVVLNEEDFISQKAFAAAYDLFHLCFKEMVENKIRENLYGKA